MSRFDLFGGSGSTLIAWEQFTGQKAVKIN